MKLLIVITSILNTFLASDLSLCENQIISRSNVTEGRIHNGHIAKPGEFPYQVGLVIKFKNSKKAWCGGSLVNNKWVLTAAHCTQNAVKVKVYLGATKRKSAQTKHSIQPKNIIIHPNYSAKPLRNDISLIKIPFTPYSSLIKPIELPDRSRRHFENELVVASGWGRTIGSKSGAVEDLYWGAMNVITNNDCGVPYHKKIKDSVICTNSAAGVAICPADSGGPLVLKSTSVQIGLSSGGFKDGCDKGYPSMFTRITSYLRWIKGYTDK